MRLQHCPPSPPSPLLALPHPLLIFSLAYSPYTAGGPSQHASDAPYHPYACSALLTCLQCYLPSLRSQCPANMPSRHASNAAYHPYARIVPARHASNAACSALPTCLQHRLPSLHSRALPTCLQCPPHTGLIFTLLQRPQYETKMPPPISDLTTPSAYNSYAPVEPSRYASDATLNPPYT
ncbi:hypothetical protein O181_065143 [Austropuccinia psidii MF-1]|uniref:Uncharacterized protein n=1 Tax=Austropuccinia psidii MF-1 TaxID=1389203 RepID=A0A9Q3I2A7_9BASI|nr:hypothetical protein [Austropuccinia psidii MF-1]